MRCGCPQCGVYMVQKEQGLLSGCTCPACLFTCSACMGTAQAPADKNALAMHAMRLQRIREEESQE